MTITDEMVEKALRTWRDAKSSTAMRDTLTAIAPLIRSAALEEAARVAAAYKDECDMRAGQHQTQRNHRSQDAALDMFVAARDIEDAIRSLKDKQP